MYFAKENYFSVYSKCSWQGWTCSKMFLIDNIDSNMRLKTKLKKSSEMKYFGVYSNMSKDIDKNEEYLDDRIVTRN